MTAARRISLALSVVTLAACAGHAPRPTTATAAAQERGAGPLAARLLPPDHRTLNFVLSEPAYVTIFEIVPGRGVSVVYPAPFDVGANRPLESGSHAVFAVPYNVGRWFYSNAPVPAAGPTYLYMIASRTPLRTDEVLQNPASLRRVVGFANFTQSNEQRTMDAIDAGFVPRNLDADSWSSDWIALWPEPALDRSPVDRRLLIPACSDGMVIVAIPGPTPAYVCTPRNTKQPPTPREPPPTDSATQPPRTPPAEAKPAPTPPANGKRPNAPRQTRAEPMSLTVDYGTPLTLASDEERAPRARTPHRSERSGERDGRSSASERSAYWGDWRREPRAPRGDAGGSVSAERAERDHRTSAGRAERPDSPTPTPRAEPRAEPRAQPAPAAAPRSTSGGQ